MRQRGLLTFLLIIPLGISMPSWATADPLPPKICAKVLLTALAYDLNLIKKRGPIIRIGIVGEESPKGTSMHKAYQSFSKMKNKGMPIEFTRLVTTKSAQVDRALKEQDLDVLHLATDDAAFIPELSALADKRDVLLLSCDQHQISKGVAIGAIARKNKPKLLINVRASKAQGASLSARLLQLSELVDR